MRLSREFYERNTILVARDLLGKIIVHRDKDVIYRGKIVESEAYIRNNDQAAHFNKGLTDRTKIIDEAGGHVYIYNIYGMYQLFNVVAEKKGVHGAVLIRAVEPLEGIHEMYLNRYKKLSDDIKERELVNLTNGPGKLVMAMNMSKEMHYGVDLVRDGNLWIEQGDGGRLSREEIVRSKRINVDYAEFGKDYLLRFYIKNNKFVSKK